MLILQRLKELNKSTTKEDLKRIYREHELNYCERTLERDIQSLREDYQLCITYDRATQTYNLDLLASPTVDEALQFLELGHTAEFFGGLLSEAKSEYRHLVTLETSCSEHTSSSSSQGAEYLTPLLSACKQSRELTIKYHKFGADKATNYRVQPYFIKEFSKRWYLMADKAQDNESRVFALDRIQSITKEDKIFTPKPNYQTETNARYQNIIGFYGYQAKPETIILSFTREQGYYVKSQPWHSSQKILIDNEQECRISLRVIPSFELERKILHDGASVRVIEPQSLKKRIQQELSDTLAHY